MSEWQNTIDTMMALAFIDEGDRITSSDLAECETAACIIQDQENRIVELEAKNAELLKDQRQTMERYRKRAGESYKNGHKQYRDGKGVEA
jgi:hypothetical protein